MGNAWFAAAKKIRKGNKDYAHTGPKSPNFKKFQGEVRKEFNKSKK